MTDLRKEARGRPCQIRLPEVCTGGGEDTVLAHFRMYTGMGQKPPDIQGAHACAACHDAVDGRLKTTHDKEFLRTSHMQAVIRTLGVLYREDKIHW